MTDEVRVPYFIVQYSHRAVAPIRCPYINPLTNTTNIRCNQGATPRELLLEASRRNNTSLLNDLLSSLSSAEKIANLLNTATDGLGCYCLHIAASYGSCRCFQEEIEENGYQYG